MKIAIAGKGGSGKTTVTTLLATYLARKNHVLAIDSDSNENLAYALGFDEKDVFSMKKIRHFTDDIYEYTKTDPDWETRHVSPHKDASYFLLKDGRMDAFLERVSLTKNRISVANLGTVDEDKRGIQSMCGSFGLMRVFLNHLKEGKDDYVLVDLPAGNELLTRATVINMDEVLLIVEPTLKNLSVAKDILISLSVLEFDHTYILVNKSFNKSDIDYVSMELSTPTSFIRRLPFSQELIELDNNGDLRFDTSQKVIQKSIEEIVSLMEKHPIDTQKLIRRAKLIDERLFPNSKSILTEETHI